MIFGVGRSSSEIQNVSETMVSSGGKQIKSLDGAFLLLLPISERTPQKMSFVSKFCKYSFLAVLYIVLLLVGAYVTWFLFPFHLIVDYSKLDQRTTPSLVDIEVNKILTHVSIYYSKALLVNMKFIQLHLKYLKQEFVTTAPNITLHVNLAGDPKGEPIFFIHGFPESG